MGAEGAGRVWGGRSDRVLPRKPGSVASPEVQPLPRKQREGGRPHAMASPWEEGLQGISVPTPGCGPQAQRQWARPVP